MCYEVEFPLKKKLFVARQTENRLFHALMDFFSEISHSFAWISEIFSPHISCRDQILLINANGIELLLVTLLLVFDINYFFLIWRLQSVSRTVSS